MSEQSEITVVRLGGTIRLVHERRDGGRLEMSLTQGETRSSSIYAVTDPAGRLHAVSARSWANQGPEPELARRMRTALQA
ncbi:hypothetical protein ACH4S8_37880 [Streptomyces sp. NPDC021080]|uniref:hypothetical protein n=1 Tax=Streptomyces sp. NPDC021080 TaxID=3365110 RepID=UPI0037B6A83B